MSIDDFTRQIGKLQSNLSALGSTTSVPATEVLSPAFIRQHTPFESFEAMCAAAGVHTAEEFKAMPNDVWDQHVLAHTKFPSWLAMQQEAGAEWAKQQITKGL